MLANAKPPTGEELQAIKDKIKEYTDLGGQYYQLDEHGNVIELDLGLKTENVDNKLKEYSETP